MMVVRVYGGGIGGKSFIKLSVDILTQVVYPMSTVV